MPCQDVWPTDEQVRIRESNEDRERHDIQARLACAYCHSLERGGIRIPEYAKMWWNKHRLMDIDRQNQENARKISLAKLSPSDRKLLGL